MWSQLVKIIVSYFDDYVNTDLKDPLGHYNILSLKSHDAIIRGIGIIQQNVPLYSESIL